MSLDILDDGKPNNVPILARTGDCDGQLWKGVPVPPSLEPEVKDPP
ncbi:hypothetical protein [Corallococcus sp. EGB]|nr:hypothetical protein [Corallococcus sp. EGB]